MPDRDSLVAAARRAAEGAYSPYSGFRVGAAVLAEDGTVFTSANVENAAYPVSQCAEANVVNYAVSQGHTVLPVVAVACIDAETVDDAYPCGRCRQIMSEFGVETIHVTTAAGEVREHTLDQLLPHRFSL
jgi:cytidine deaminase